MPENQTTDELTDQDIADLAALARVLAYHLRRANPKSVWPDRAADFLRRKGLAGSPLRVEVAMPEHNTTVSIQPGMAALLRGLAQRQGRTVEWTVHEAIRRWLHDEAAALHADDEKEPASGR